MALAIAIYLEGICYFFNKKPVCKKLSTGPYDFLCKSIDWILFNKDLHHEKLNHSVFFCCM